MVKISVWSAIFLILALAESMAFATESYTVQFGDTLGSIAHRFSPDKPIWGRDGAAAQLYSQNTSVIQNPNKIFPGQVLSLGQSSLATPVAKETGAPSNEQAEPTEEKTETNSANTTTNLPSNRAPAAPERPGLVVVGAGSSLWERHLTDKTTGASGVARSNPATDVSVSVQFPVAQEWDISSGIHYDHVTFANAANRVLAADAENFVGFDLGMVHHLETFSYIFGARYEQIPLITGVNATTVGVTSFHVASPYAGLWWNARTWGKTRVDMATTFSYELGSSVAPYDFKGGWTTEFTLPITRQVSESNTLGIMPFVSYGSRETNTVTHRDWVFGAKAVWLWSL